MKNAIGQTPPRVEQKLERTRRRYYLKMNLRSIYACFRLRKDPSRGFRFVFMMGDSQDNIAESERRLGKLSDPHQASGALMSLLKTRLQATPYDIGLRPKLPADI